jgi:hypothetical protein
MATTTLFINFNQPVENKSLLDIMIDIQSGKYKSDIERLRDLIKQEDFENADILKKQLPAFTPSATFKGGRKPEFLDKYSHFVHLDFDKLPQDKLEEAFQKIIKIPYTFACFRSPSGNGLKVFIEVTTGAEHHSYAYKEVMDYYELALGILCDPKCKDITRLCFVSYDPESFRNVRYLPFEVIVKKPVQLLKESPLPVLPDYQKIFEECVKFTELKEQYIDGNRNNFIYLLASNCNRKGIPEDTANNLITANFDLSEQEATASVKSAFKNHLHEFANFAKSASLQSSISEQPDEDYLKTSPVIPSAVYEQLPLILRNGASAFTELRERDVFLTGALSILSGCLPAVRGIYDRQLVYPGLFSFTIAPAASGKGALKFAKMLADQFHEVTLESSRNEKSRFDAEMNEYKSRQRFKAKNEVIGESPVEPPFKVVFIPANSSYAKILAHLQQNDGEGIICETEADTMGNVFKQEWGSYSDMLRKSFHHERISSSRKGNNEYIEVNAPRLAVALSGTPNQVVGLINSAEDGLFSRFIFYVFKVDQVWKDVSPSANKINLTQHFTQLSGNVHELVQYLNQSPTNVYLSDEQWQVLNNTCGQWLHEVTTFTSESAGSIVKRLGLILYRLAMIFSAMRKFESQSMATELICNDVDFHSALQLADLYLKHSLLMFHNLPKQEDSGLFRSGDNKKKFFDALPASFKRQEAIELAKSFNLSARSVDAMLKALLGSRLSQPNYGTYLKA